MTKLILFCVVGLFAFSNVLDVQGQYTIIARCYGHWCPEDTTFCLSFSNTTEDDSHIVTTISCLDSNLTSLYSYNRTHINIFGPDISFESARFTNVWEIIVPSINQSGSTATTNNSSTTNATATTTTTNATSPTTATTTTAANTTTTTNNNTTARTTNSTA